MIISRIFEHLPASCVSTAARVCSTWARAANNTFIQSQSQHQHQHQSQSQSLSSSHSHSDGNEKEKNVTNSRETNLSPRTASPTVDGAIEEKDSNDSISFSCNFLWRRLYENTFEDVSDSATTMTRVSSNDDNSSLREMNQYTQPSGNNANNNNEEEDASLDRPKRARLSSGPASSALFLDSVVRMISQTLEGRTLSTPSSSGLSAAVAENRRAAEQRAVEALKRAKKESEELSLILPCYVRSWKELFVLRTLTERFDCFFFFLWFQYHLIFSLS